MIALYQGPRMWQSANMSPFCVKLETYLRMAGIEYQVKAFNPQKAPKGKMPYIKDGDQMVSDSGLIIDHLKRTRGDILDQHLSDEDRAKGHLMRRMIEEHTYWGGVYFRWSNDQGFAAIKKVLQGIMPPVLNLVMPNILRSQIKKALHGQGLGRHSEAELVALMTQDIQAIEVLLGDTDYLFGDEPSSFDATLYGFFSCLGRGPIDNPLKDLIRSNQRFMDYLARIDARYYADVPEVGESDT